MYCVFFFFLNRAMFTDGLVECQKDIISLNGVTAKGMKNLIDFAYSSKLVLDFGKLFLICLFKFFLLCSTLSQTS